MLGRNKRVGRGTAPNVSRVIGYALIGYGVVGLAGTFFYTKWLVGIVAESLRTRSTWPFFQNYGLAAVLGAAFSVLTVWGVLGLGVLLLRRPRTLFPVFLCMTAIFFVRAVLQYFIPNQGLSDLSVFQHVSYFSNSFAWPAGLLVAAIAVWKSEQTPSTGDSQIVCNQCGYDMRGLSEPRCPECGRVYNLDEFYEL